jgi:uroporphyrinogen decarboxylase
MRQAGRYLPEYLEVRAKHSMLDVIRTPALAAEVTLQPLRRFDFDASIIFSDILSPLIGMGIELDFIAGEGPKIFNPIKQAADVARLKVPKVEENVGYTFEAMQRVTAELSPRGIPLIGFSGAPYTLSSYLLEEESPQTGQTTKKFIWSERPAWNDLQEKLTEMVAEYLVAQVTVGGASAVQLFDSWVGALSPRDFNEFVAPSLVQILQHVRSKTSVPVVYFGTGLAGLYSSIAPIGFDVIGVDWRLSLKEARGLLGQELPLQGNLDPLVLFGSKDDIARAVTTVLDDARGLRSHIFNLGHGILPRTPIESVHEVIRIVRAYQ